ncbi:sensor histidine kinase [Fictibacillus fluitans]|uniref:histidine kinase n=1 Tax=Fictibacillus fluitans TaxID=3058422 RepID=A0ABT8HY37_9BACL|nr:sensor histidine kinase [Fictibacillus sp. NE201]MDN4525693.1 sensor histidine kinase [Fictibacillus sp. NE201]
MNMNMQWAKRLKRANTLRNQILFIYLLVMAIVLTIVAFLMLDRIGELVKNNAEKQIQQTAVEANGRLETLYRQIDTLSNQLVTNRTIQQMMQDTSEGKTLGPEKKKALLGVIQNFLAYSDGIYSFELYSQNGTKIFPYDDNVLSSRIDGKWILKADEEKGRLVWTGLDAKDADYSYAVRRVNLMDHWFKPAGYLLVRIANPYFQIKDSGGDQKEYMLLLDRDSTPITSNYPGNTRNLIERSGNSVSIGRSEYMIVKEHSEITGWTLVILKPMSFLMEGLSVVRTSVLFSGVIGYVIFFVFSIFLSAVITRPIKRLTHIMKNAKMDELKFNPELSSTIEIAELNKTYNQMVENTNHLIQEVYEKELLRSQTELKALQAQIDPHFLYNTLNALYWSLDEKEEEELAEVVIAMSELFRYTINPAHHDEWVTVREELEHVERYLSIMKMRLGERLDWKIEQPYELANMRIPKLMIQPLVENAVFHGIEKQRKNGVIVVGAERAEHSETVIISVKDNGPGMDAQALAAIRQAIENGTYTPSKRLGIALQNVNKRLRLYFGKQERGALRIDSEKGRGTTVSFEIPLKEKSDDGGKNDIDR